MTNENRILALVSLDEQINRELYSLESNLTEISGHAADQTVYRNLNGHAIQIQTLFDRSAELRRDLSVEESNPLLLEYLQAKEHIATNYLRFNRLRSQILKALESFGHTKEEVPERVFAPGYEDPHPSEPEREPEELPAEESTADEELLAALEAEEKENRLAEKKKAEAKKKAKEKALEEQQRRRQEEEHRRMQRQNEDDRRRIEEEETRRRNAKETANRQGTSNTPPVPQQSAPYDSPQNSTYPSYPEYPDERPQKQISAADRRDEQYRNEDLKAAERAKQDERRRETHDKFIQYQEEHKYKTPEAPVPPARPQNIVFETHNIPAPPENRNYPTPGNGSFSEPGGRPTSAADRRDAEFREQDRRREEDQRRSERRNELHHKFQEATSRSSGPPAYSFAPGGVVYTGPSSGPFMSSPAAENKQAELKYDLQTARAEYDSKRGTPEVGAAARNYAEKREIYGAFQNGVKNGTIQTQRPTPMPIPPSRVEPPKKSKQFTSYGYTPTGTVATTVENGKTGKTQAVFSMQRTAPAMPRPIPSALQRSNPSNTGDPGSKRPSGGSGITGSGSAGNGSWLKGSTGQSRRENLNRPKKATVEEPGAGLQKNDSHLRTKHISSYYVKSIGSRFVGYGRATGSMLSRRLNSMMQNADESGSLHGMENARYYGFAAAGVVNAIAHARVVNSKRISVLGTIKDHAGYGGLAGKSAKELSREFNPARHQGIALKKEIRELSSKGSSLSGSERLQLLSKRQELSSVSRKATTAKSLQNARYHRKIEIEMSKAFEKGNSLGRITQTSVAKEIAFQRQTAERSMAKKFGALTKVTDKSLASEISSLKAQGRNLKSRIKALQAKGSLLTAAERKQLQQLMKKHQANSLRLRKLMGLQGARMELAEKMKFGAKIQNRLAKNARGWKGGAFALYGLLLKPLQGSDDIGLQGVSFGLNVASNHHVHAFVKTSLRAGWGATKFVAHNARTSGKAASNALQKLGKQAAQKATANSSLLKTTTKGVKELSARLAPKKVKTAVEGVSGAVKSVGKKIMGKTTGQAAKTAANALGKAAKAVSSFVSKASALLGKVLLYAAVFLLILMLVMELISVLPTFVGGITSSTVMSPYTSEDGKIDLEPYYNIILDEWNDYVSDLNAHGRAGGYYKVVVDMDAAPGNVHEILSMLAVRMTQDLSLEENSEVEPYLRYLVRRTNPYSEVVSTCYCAGRNCRTVRVDETRYVAYCLGDHPKLTITVSPMHFGAEDQLNDPIFSADEMANAGMNGVAGARIGNFRISYYCIERYDHICNDGSPDSTATGTVPTPGRTIAVDPDVIPLGTHVIINGREYVAEDTGGAIDGNRIDIVVATHAEATRLGVQNSVPVYHVTYNGEGIESSGEWQGWNNQNREWAKTIYHQDWGLMYTGIPNLYGGSNSTDLSGVHFVNGNREGNQAIVDFAKAEEGYREGNKFYSWYGFDGHVHWCATFVSWCADKTGVLGTAIPKFAHCAGQGVPWFKSQGQWAKRGDITPVAGDIIFFDWEQDGNPDHVGIVVGSDGSRVYTVEGNSGDYPGVVAIKSYSLSYGGIYGYGLPNY